MKVYWLIITILISSCGIIVGRPYNPYLEATKEEKAKFKKVRLPFSPITTFYVLQGAHDRRQPENLYTWNLEVHANTPVFAMEGGKVIKVKRKTVGGGCNKKFKGEETYIWVRHLDKTIGMYKYMRPIVILNQVITPGQKIGYTNMSGHLCRPQLEISTVKSEVLLNSRSQQRTIPLLFKGVRGGIIAHRRSY